MSSQTLLFALLLPLFVSAPEYGQIQGVVVGSDGLPVPYATVTAKGRDGQILSAAVADEVGKFELTSLAEGRYVLSVTKAAHVEASFGAIVAGAPGVPVHLADGAVVSGIRLELHKGSVVSGQVLALDGVPLPWHRVELFRVTRSGSRESVSKVVSDDRGEFRAFGLPAGRYAVCVSRTRMAFDSGATSLSEQQVDELLASLAKGQQPTAADVRSTRGLEAHHEGVSCVGDSPGTEIELAPGQAKEGLSVLVLPIQLSRVSGFAHRASTVMLMPASLNVGMAPRESRVDATGRFAIDGVVAGNYRLVAMSTSPVVEAGVVDLAVSGGDVEGVAIVVNPLVPVAGRIVSGEGTAPIAPSGLRVNLTRNIENASATRSSTSSIKTLIVEPSAQVRSDGTFVFQGVLPGAYRIRIQGLQSGWRLRSLSIGNQRLEGATLNVTHQSGDMDLVALVDASQTGVAGDVTAAVHLRASDHMVLAFPRDRATWGDSTVFKLAAPDQRGHYELNGMSAGAYWIVAAPPMSVGALLDRSDVLEALVQRANPIELADGVMLNVPLNIGRMW